MGLVLNFQENVEFEKSDHSFESAVFVLLPSCYFNADSMSQTSNLLFLDGWKYAPGSTFLKKFLIKIVKK